MASNLLISTPGIERQAGGVLSSIITWRTEYPVENAIRGARSSLAKTLAAVNTSSFDIDLSGAGGPSEVPDHLILSRLDLMTERDTGDISVTVFADDNAGFTSPTTIIDTVGTADLLGPYNEDGLIDISAFASAENFWRVNIATFQTEVHEWAFARLGKWFDLGRDPVYPLKLEPGEGSGNVKRRGYSLTADWRGLTEGKIQEFEQRVVFSADSDPIWLYDTNNCALSGFTLLPCRLTSYQPTRVQENTFDLRVVFREFV